MNLTEAEARERFCSGRVARLATVGAEGRPHLVPVTFDADDRSIVIAIDHKPKRPGDLQRLRNIRGNPGVALLVDHYDEDWTALWWARADGLARVVEDEAERAGPIERLRRKYPQYAQMVPTGPVIVVAVTAWRGWSYTPPAE
jgi:PPOX class probable F420-dependent enzyme